MSCETVKNGAENNVMFISVNLMLIYVWINL